MSETIRINNTNLTFNKVYYVSVNGNNATGNGSINNPYGTVLYVAQHVAQSGDAIFALPGIHTVTSLIGDWGTGGVFDWGKNIAFIGEPGRTIFSTNGNSHSFACHNPVNCYGGSKIYNIIFDITYASRHNTRYRKALFSRHSTTRVFCTTYNCVFICRNNFPSFIYDNSWSSTVITYNCVVISPSNMDSPHTGTITNYNLASNVVIHPAGATNITCLSSVLFDKDYNITSGNWNHAGTGTNPDGSRAHIGVYGGEFAWRPPNYSLIKANNKIYTLESNLWKEVPNFTLADYEEYSIIENMCQLSKGNKKSFVLAETSPNIFKKRVNKKDYVSKITKINL